MEKSLDFKIITFVFLWLIAIACANKKEPKKLGSETKIFSKVDTSVRACIPYGDTVLDQKNSVGYVVVDSFFTLRVKIDGNDTLLPYRFDCSVTRGLVPSLYAYYKNTICLLRGAGQNFRQFVVCYENKDSIFIKKYETALGVDLKHSIVVYQDFKNPETIYIVNFRNGNKKVVYISMKSPSTRIVETFFLKGVVFFRLDNGKLFRFSINEM